METIPELQENFRKTEVVRKKNEVVQVKLVRFVRIKAFKQIEIWISLFKGVSDVL